MSERLEAVFTFDKDTANTRRYKEDPDNPPFAGYLYLQQWAARKLGDGTMPERVRVTVTVEEVTE